MALRVGLIPVFVALAAGADQAVRAGAPGTSERLTALAALCAIGLSDVADGFLARRLGQETRLGAVLDAAADKLAQVVLTAFFVLFAGPAFPRLPLWFLGVLVGRDALLGSGLVVLHLRCGPLRVVHRSHGKFTSAILFALLTAATAGAAADQVAAGAAGATVLVLASTGLYVRDGLRRCAEAEGAA